MIFEENSSGLATNNFHEMALSCSPLHARKLNCVSGIQQLHARYPLSTCCMHTSS